MTIHIAANTGCNLGCTYCYEEPDRELKQKQIDNEYDIELIMERLEEWADTRPHEAPGMHGGEPLLLRIEHLERIYQFIQDHWPGHGSHIQTNGTLITDEHIELFKAYNVSVGVSVDGPVALNRQRLARSGGKDVTDHMSQRTLDAIDRLADAGVGVGVIIVLHDGNAGDDEKLETLLDWMDDLTKRGVTGHFNPAIPYSDVQTDVSLSPERLKAVYLRTWEWMMEPGQTHRTWNPMRNMQDNLLGNSLKNCVNGYCDVYNAGAAQIIKGDGETTGCGKTWSAVGDGIPFLQGDSTDNEYNKTRERYELLKQIPSACDHDADPDDDSPDLGGLRGCRYWAVTHGGCPASGIDEDYRNRSIWHEAIHALYERIEGDMRRLFPGIRLVTDLPWDAESGEKASRGELDIKPFATMRPDTKGPSSVQGGTSQFGSPMEEADLRTLSFEDIVAEYKSKYPAEILTIDTENKSIHADSA